MENEIETGVYMGYISYLSLAVSDGLEKNVESNLLLGIGKETATRIDSLTLCSFVTWQYGRTILRQSSIY